MKINNDPLYVRRRRVATTLVLTLVVLVTLLWVWVFRGGSDATTEAASAQGATESAGSEATEPVEVESPAPELSPAEEQGEEADPANSSLVQVQRITGDLSPKSIVASEKGQLFAQNMMYTHTMSVFTADGALQKTIPDSVDLADFGVEGHPGTSQGAPVEMAFSPGGDTAWVSQYSMYGEGFLPEGADACEGPEGISNSYVYKVDTASLEITDVIEVGAVPKYVAVTPDGSTVLVSNWCSMDLSVIDVEQGEVTSTVPLGGDNPRGIAVSPDSSTAYVALMGADRTVAVDLGAGSVKPDFSYVSDAPRHVLVSPNGAAVYVSNNNEGTIAELDAATGEATRVVATGGQPRSMTMSPDGAALYVGNYASSTVSKVSTESFEVMQTVPTDDLPIGITYEPTKGRVWVACYGGSLLVFDDTRAAL